MSVPFQDAETKFAEVSADKEIADFRINVELLKLQISYVVIFTEDSVM